MNDINLIFNSKSDDILRELNTDELLILEKIYKDQSIDLKYHYLLIYNQKKWDEKINDIKNNINSKKINFLPFQKKFFTHRNGNLLKNGTYFSFAIDCKITITCHTLESTYKELEECLRETNMILWKEGPLFAGIHKSITPLIEKIVNDNGSLIERNRECIFYLYNNKIAKNLTIDIIDEKYNIRPLSENYIEFIHNLWPNNKEGSLDFISGLILLNKSYGIYLENSLIAWIFQNEFSGIGILHVMTEERKKGFAQVLIKLLTKEIAILDENIDVSAFTVCDNFVSQNLLEKVGYIKIINTFWMQLIKIK